MNHKTFFIALTTMMWLIPNAKGTNINSKSNEDSLSTSKQTTLSSTHYNKITIGSSNIDRVKFVGAIQTDSATFILATYTSAEPYERGYLGNMYAICNNKKYKLLSAINIPLWDENQKLSLILNHTGQQHNFALMFERIPMDGPFDIIETSIPGRTAWEFKNIAVDSNSTTQQENLRGFIDKTPQMLENIIVQNGGYYLHIWCNGITILYNCSKIKNYGSYYRTNVTIISDKSVTINERDISAEGFILKRDGVKSFPMKILTAADYYKKVRKKQSRAAAANAWYENSAAEKAGKTTISSSANINTNSRTSSSGNYAGGSVAAGAAVGTNGAAVGVGASTYGGSYSSNSRYSNNTSVNSNTTIRDGAAEYWARQNANNNIQQYNNKLLNERSTLLNNYLKNTTIEAYNHYSSYFNIKYKKTDFIVIRIKINGMEFPLALKK